MSARRRPRPIAAALEAVREAVAPETPLAAIQAAWPEAVGERIAAEARPVAERDGVVTVACRAATWAQELDLLHDELLAKLRARLQERGGAEVERLRMIVSADRYSDTD